MCQIWCRIHIHCCFTKQTDVLTINQQLVCWVINTQWILFVHLVNICLWYILYYVYYSLQILISKPDLTISTITEGSKDHETHFYREWDLILHGISESYIILPVNSFTKSVIPTLFLTYLGWKTNEFNNMFTINFKTGNMCYSLLHYCKANRLTRITCCM